MTSWVAGSRRRCSSDIEIPSGNPKTFKALVDALTEASQWIEAHKAEAAETYIRVEQSKLDPAFVKSVIDNKDVSFTTIPQGTFKYADFLAQDRGDQEQAGKLEGLHLRGTPQQTRKLSWMSSNNASRTASAPAVLEISRLTLDYETENGKVRAVENVDLFRRQKRAARRCSAHPAAASHRS